MADYENDLPDAEYDEEPDAWAEAGPRVLRPSLDQLVAEYLAQGGTITVVDSSVYRHDETQQGDFMIREVSNKRVALNNKRTAARLAAEPENAEKIRCAIREGHKGIVCIAKAAGLTYMVARFIAHKYGIEIPTRDGHPLREPGVTCAGKSKVQRAEMLEGA